MRIKANTSSTTILPNLLKMAKNDSVIQQFHASMISKQKAMSLVIEMIEIIQLDYPKDPAGEFAFLQHPLLFRFEIFLL